MNIVELLKDGALLNCTEGTDYKTWLEFPNGNKQSIRRDTAEKICNVYMDKLNFGNDGITWKSKRQEPKLANQRSPFGMFS